MYQNQQKIPHHPEAEISVIGGILHNNEVLYEAEEILQPRDFYTEKNRWVYETILELHHNGEIVDVLTLSDKLQKKGLFEKIGGSDYFVRVVAEAPLSSTFKQYCHILREKAQLRNLIRALENSLKDCYGDYDVITDVMDATEQRIFGVTQPFKEAEDKTAPEVIGDALEQLKVNIAARGKLSGLSSGFKELDEKYTFGFQPENLIIIGARPSMGKTALAINIMTHGLLAEQAHVALFSLEMTAKEVGNRMISAHSGIHLNKINQGDISEEEFHQYNDSAALFYNAIFDLSEKGDATILDIRRKCRRLKAEKGLDLVIIDHLQLLRTGKKTDNPYFEIRELSRELKSLAKELKVPVICLSQLNRGVEGRNNHRPTLADLKESGSIEQDADLVLLLHRESYYKDKPDNQAELIVAKNRNGKTGTIPLIWHPEVTGFTSA